MEVVNQLPRPTEPAALARLVEAQKILCARAVSEEDCEQAQALLEELASSADEGGFDYFPALLTLASLHATGFEPAIERDDARAARYYLRFLADERAATGLDSSLLEEAATQLCNLVKEGQAKLGEAERHQLKELSRGEGAGSVPLVATWVRYASAEADRLFFEASEDPAARERRLARQAAREAAHAEELERQRAAAQDALARAEELQLEGNDVCRQGSLPGNAKAQQLLTRATEIYGAATAVLSDCLPGLSLAAEEASDVRRRRGILQSNTAQVYLTLEDWEQARRFSQKAMEDDPEHAKSWFRLARAEINLKDWECAARTVDQALLKLRGRRGEEVDGNRAELWRLAEEISKSLPEWQWSSAKPEQKQKKAEEDFERRIVGHWKYGGGQYEICLEPWGALVFKEETVKIDLMRKGKLRWAGEFEMISGMEIKISYEPGADVLMTDFTPPPDIPEEQKYKGPMSFTATRVPAPPREEPEAAQEPPQEEPAPPKPAIPPSPPPKAEVAPAQQPEAVAPVKVPVDVPKELWLSGHEGLSGCYKLLPDKLLNERPVYRRAPGDDESAGDRELFLWYRGGNWGVTATLHSSSLAAPFLVRSADNPARSQHPLELRRPRWHVRRGRGQEEIDPAVHLDAVASGAVEVEEQPSKPHVAALDAKPEESTQRLRKTLELHGRTGLHSEVNGCYDLSGRVWSGRPVYFHSEQKMALFQSNGYWVLAKDVCTIPCALARCYAVAAADAAGPPTSSGAVWEFLDGQSSQGHMVAVETRKYSADRAVSLRCVAADDISGAATPVASAESGAVDAATTVEEHSEHMRERTHVNGNSGVADPCSVKPKPFSPWPPWVQKASAELESSTGQIRATVVACDGIPVDLQNLSLDVALECLKVGLAGQEALCLALPAAVDTESGPVARWSEKTRTLKVRLALHA
mmetsp:Transcript_23292/g.40967  ORF Transcript_23292/g.40967 Transcript_23292/m.40967 type:complete len:927 (+) Transcript_23292:60-2840(+)